MMKKKQKQRIKFYYLILIILVAFFGYKMYNYWPKIYSNNKEAKDLELKYEKLLDEEETLTGNVKKLQDPDYIARFFRSEHRSSL